MSLQLKVTGVNVKQRWQNVLKLVSQERIRVKEGDDAKEQFSKIINDLATLEEEKFLYF